VDARRPGGRRAALGALVALRPGGRLLLVEGDWATGVGLPGERCLEVVLRHRREATVRQLGDDSALWGRDVDDERYLLVSLTE
jgi:hypothetical protein